MLHEFLDIRKTGSGWPTAIAWEKISPHSFGFGLCKTVPKTRFYTPTHTHTSPSIHPRAKPSSVVNGHFLNSVTGLHIGNVKSLKASFWGLFKTNFCGHFRKLFLFTKYYILIKSVSCFT